MGQGFIDQPIAAVVSLAEAFAVQLDMALVPTVDGVTDSAESELTAAEADPSRGALYERVLAAYLAPAIDPVTGDYRTSEPCAPSTHRRVGLAWGWAVLSASASYL